MNVQLITTNVVTILTIVGLIVLIALGKVTFAEGGPLIAALAGVHGGAVLTNAAAKS